MINEKTIKIPNRLSRVNSKIKEFYSKVDEFVENNKYNLEKNIEDKIAEAQAKFQPRLEFWRDRLHKDKMAKKRSWLLNPTFSIALIKGKDGDDFHNKTSDAYKASYRMNLPGQPNDSGNVHVGVASKFPEGPESPELKNLAKQKIITYLMKYYPGYYRELGISDTPEELVRKSDALEVALKKREEYDNENYSKVQAEYASEMKKLKEEKMNLKNEVELLSILKPNFSLVLFPKNDPKYVRASLRFPHPVTGESIPAVVHIAPISVYPDWRSNQEIRTLAEIKVLLFMLGKFPGVFKKFFDESDFTF